MYISHIAISWLWYTGSDVIERVLCIPQSSSINGGSLSDYLVFNLGHALGESYLSPYVEEPLNSKVIKCFVRELRSRKCFSCFGIPMLSMYVRYGHYQRFAYRYEYVYFTYSYLAMQHDHITFIRNIGVDLYMSNNFTKFVVVQSYKVIIAAYGHCDTS